MPRSNTQFQKGRSGNPRGRPRICREIRSLARAYGPDCVALLAEMAGFSSKPAAPYPIRFAAAKELLDRAFGRPRIAGENDGEARRVVVEYRWNDGTDVATNVAPVVSVPLLEAQNEGETETTDVKGHQIDDETQPEGEVIWSETTD